MRTAMSSCQRQKVLEQVASAFGEDRLRMKLHPPDGVRAMPEGVNLRRVILGMGRDLQLRRETLRFDGQGMIAHDLERRWNPGEDSPPVVTDPRCLAVHHLSSAHDPT